MQKIRSFEALRKKKGKHRNSRKPIGAFLLTEIVSPDTEPLTASCFSRRKTLHQPAKHTPLKTATRTEHQLLFLHHRVKRGCFCSLRQRKAMQANARTPQTLLMEKSLPNFDLAPLNRAKYQNEVKQSNSHNVQRPY